MAVKNLLGELLSANRRARQMTQQEVADKVGMTRELYSQLETGRRKEPVAPVQAEALCALFGISMLTFVNAMGYHAEVLGFENDEEVALMRAYRSLEPAAQRFLLRGLGI